MVQIKVEPGDWTEPTRKYPLCKAHRNNRPNQTTDPPFGLDDLPIRLTGEYHVTSDRRHMEWHPRVCAYELQVMWTWGSWKAQRAGQAVGDEIELGWRVALELVDQSTKG